MKYRVFLTGDLHGQFSALDRIKKFCRDNELTRNDYMIVLGDVGANFWHDERDHVFKKKMQSIPITWICVHGNHEDRPANIATYQHGYNYDIQAGCWWETEFPNILFPNDGEMILNNNVFLILGGAYSIDKYYRLTFGSPWFADEQMPKEVQEKILRYIETEKQFDYVLSHTAPLNYEPRELFLPSIDQSKVDKTMENFLQKIYDQIDFKVWYFGHYHDDFWTGDKTRLVFKDIIEIE